MEGLLVSNSPFLGDVLDPPLVAVPYLPFVLVAAEPVWPPVQESRAGTAPLPTPGHGGAGRSQTSGSCLTAVSPLSHCVSHRCRLSHCRVSPLSHHGISPMDLTYEAHHCVSPMGLITVTHQWISAMCLTTVSHRCLAANHGDSTDSSLPGDLSETGDSHAASRLVSLSHRNPR